MRDKKMPPEPTQPLTCTTCGAPAMAVRPGTEAQQLDLVDLITLDRGVPMAAWCGVCWRKSLGLLEVDKPAQPQTVDWSEPQDPTSWAESPHDPAGPAPPNVIPAFGTYRTPCAPAEIVELLREYLGQAMRGEISGVAICGLRPNDSCFTDWNAGNSSGFALVGAAAILEANLIDKGRCIT